MTTIDEIEELRLELRHTHLRRGISLQDRGHYRSMTARDMGSVKGIRRG